MQTTQNAPQAAQAPRSTLPLTPAQAKRLVGILGVSNGVPVRYAGYVVRSVQRKRHPYDEWTDLELAGQIDTSASSLRYRATITPAPRTRLTPTED